MTVPRRPDPLDIWLAILNALVAGLCLGAPLWGPERLLALAFVVLAIRDWRRYWRAHDEFEAWRQRVGR